MFQRVKQYMGIGDSESDSSLPFSLLAAGGGDLTLVKDGPGLLLAIHAINVNAAVRYLKFYDSKIRPTAGKGIPVRRYAIPGATVGAGFVLQPCMPMKFVNGIGFTLVTGVADTDATAVTANDVILTLEYV